MDANQKLVVWTSVYAGVVAFRHHPRVEEQFWPDTRERACVAADEAVLDAEKRYKLWVTTPRP